MVQSLLKIIPDKSMSQNEIAVRVQDIPASGTALSSPAEGLQIGRALLAFWSSTSAAAGFRRLRLQTKAALPVKSAISRASRVPAFFLGFCGRMLFRQLIHEHKTVS